MVRRCRGTTPIDAATLRTRFSPLASDELGVPAGHPVVVVESDPDGGLLGWSPGARPVVVVGLRAGRRARRCGSARS